MQLNLKPSHAKVKEYYTALHQYGQLNISHETAVRQAFASLLDTCARQFKWKLVQEFRIPTPKNKSVIVDGAVLDSFTLKHGFWEAKDLKDQLEKEIKKKLELGYPRNNIIFQSPERAILYQKGIRQGLNDDITDAENLVELLRVFFDYREPQHEEWESAVAEFSERIPEIANAVKEIIEKERRKNQKFVAAFEGFVQLCRQAINPNLSEEAVETMLIQHLLTERIFRKVFNNPEFTRRNIIAAEIEKVIDSLTSKHFSRDAFLQDLDRFYRAIEVNAENATDFAEKQSFLNTVYERFFQGFSPKEADTHGIVYTPQPIVNFMVRSVEETLKKEFGKSLSDKEVHILDPFVGTGNFIVRIMQEIKKTALPYKYVNELHCNEVMLLPYYIASMNIEHAYLEATGEYKAFEGICLVDTFELAEDKQIQMFTAKNSERVQKQKDSPIFVIIGNPPYNVGQESENENNKNRKYPALDKKISDTYKKLSVAALKNKYGDPYIRAFKWATDRIGEEGLVAYISNHSFLRENVLDGIRRQLPLDFDAIYSLDLGGNVYRNQKLSGTTHNVFGIKPGVAITLFIKRKNGRRPGRVFYSRLDEYWRKEQKLYFLGDTEFVDHINWIEIFPNRNGDWLRTNTDSSYGSLMSLGSAKNALAGDAIFNVFSLGCSTNRDPDAYGWTAFSLQASAKRLVSAYNFEVARYITAGRPKDLDAFVDYSKLKWSEHLKKSLTRCRAVEFNTKLVREALYRPFVGKFLYFDRTFVDRRGLLPGILPEAASDNTLLCVSTGGGTTPFHLLATKRLPDLHLVGDSQCFPFYSYDENSSNRRENITDWALERFRTHYKDKKITKWDIILLHLCGTPPS